jgi:hypothetical protein
MIKVKVVRVDAESVAARPHVLHEHMTAHDQLALLSALSPHISRSRTDACGLGARNREPAPIAPMQTCNASAQHGSSER